jgi:hypothetical protein
VLAAVIEIVRPPKPFSIIAIDGAARAGPRPFQEYLLLFQRNE